MSLRRVTTLAQVERIAAAHPMVLLITTSAGTPDEAVVASVGARFGVAAYLVLFHAAEQALLDKYAVSSVPLLVYIRQQWHAMVVGVHRHEVEEMCSWAAQAPKT